MRVTIQSVVSLRWRIIATLFNMLDANTREHSIRVARYSVAIGEKLGIDPYMLDLLCLGATLHDLGKTIIPRPIMLKRHSLDKSELALMRWHPIIGYCLLEMLSLPREITTTALCHHEKQDSTGYPNRLRGASIPLNARVVAVADSFDAMTSDRSYRARIPFCDAVHELNRHANCFDAQVLDIFVATVLNYLPYADARNMGKIVPARTSFSHRSAGDNDTECKISVCLGLNYSSRIDNFHAKIVTARRLSKWDC